MYATAFINVEINKTYVGFLVVKNLINIDIYGLSFIIIIDKYCINMKGKCVNE